MGGSVDNKNNDNDQNAASVNRPENFSLSGFLIQSIAVLIMGVFACVALWIVVKAIDASNKTLAAEDWVQVPAHIIEYDRERTLHKSGIGPRSGSSMLSKITVSYSYEFEGKKYNSGQLEFGGAAENNFTKKRQARQIRLMEKKKVTAFVDPLNPQDSVLDRSLPTERIVFGMVFLLFPCAIGTTLLVGLLLRPLKSRDRYQMPVMGILHGGLPLFFLIRHFPSYSVLEVSILLVLSSLFFAGGYFLFSRAMGKMP